MLDVTGAQCYNRAQLKNEDEPIEDQRIIRGKWIIELYFVLIEHTWLAHLAVLKLHQNSILYLCILKSNLIKWLPVTFFVFSALQSAVCPIYSFQAFGVFSRHLMLQALFTFSQYHFNQKLLRQTFKCHTFSRKKQPMSWSSTIYWLVWRRNFTAHLLVMCYLTSWV